MPRDSVYLDACGWIAQYKPEEELSDAERSGMAALRGEVERGTVILAASSLLLVQLLTVSAEVIEAAFDGRKGIMVAADDTICRVARELQDKCYKEVKKMLSAEDAIHLATASALGCTRFVTLDVRRKDSQLSPLRDREMLQRHLGLKILNPSEYALQPSLDLSAPEP